MPALKHGIVFKIKIETSFYYVKMGANQKVEDRDWPMSLFFSTHGSHFIMTGTNC